MIINYVGAKLLTDVVIFSIFFSSESPIDVLVKNLKIFLYEKYIVPLRTLYPFIKSFLNPFVDIASTVSDSSFNSFSISAGFVLFELILLLKLNSLLSKSVFFTKLAISFLLGLVMYLLL